jgi:hypothetical protein
MFYGARSIDSRSLSLKTEIDRSVRDDIRQLCE